MYRVKAINSVGMSGRSSYLNVETPEVPTPSAPAKPTGLISAASHDNVLLAWDDPVDDTVTGYQILRGPDADNLTVLVDDTSSNATSYSLTPRWSPRPPTPTPSAPATLPG